MGDGDYMFAFQQVIMPIAIEFDPDLVIGRFLSCLVCRSETDMLFSGCWV
jgi:hypothetical protein